MKKINRNLSTYRNIAKNIILKFWLKIRYRWQEHKRYIMFIMIITVVLLLSYSVFLQHKEYVTSIKSILSLMSFENIVEFIECIVAIFAAVFVFLELRQSKRLNEAQLIKELNCEFINNESLSLVEHKLEIYYSHYRHVQNETEKKSLKLELDLDTNSNERQYLVNYLVHLESIASLVNGSILKLSVISELMAYRFFIAVHNPEVQEVELRPYKEFYRGCYKLHEKWTKQLQKEEKYRIAETGDRSISLIPMREYEDFFAKNPWEKRDEPMMEPPQNILEYIQWFYQYRDISSNPAVYFYDLTAIRTNIENLKQGMPKNVTVYYAMKANPHKDVMECIQKENIIKGIEIASEGELRYALRYYKSKNIIFTGPGKTAYELEQAIVNDIKYINVESVTEAYRINAIAERLKKAPVDVLLRINLNCSIEEGEKMTGYSTKMGIDEDVFVESFKMIKNLDKVRIKGIHAFAASGVLNYEVLLKIHRYIFDLVSRLQEELGNIQVIDFGGGLGIDYSDEKRIFDIESYKRGLAKMIDEYKFKNKEIIMELGTYITGNAGYYTAQIIDIKSTKGKKHIIIAGGINHMGLPLEMQRKHPMQVIPMNLKDLYPDQPCVDSETADISGPLCIVSDKLWWEGTVEKAEIGDIVVFYQAGAYCYEEGMHDFLMHRLPVIEIFDVTRETGRGLKR